MRQYQSFLSSSPTFLGLNFYDLGTLCLFLNLSLFLEIDQNYTFYFVIVPVILRRIIHYYIDVSALILFLLNIHKKRRINLSELMTGQRGQR